MTYQELVAAELERADAKHGPMPNAIAGLWTIRCELEELAREIVGFSEPDLARVAAECIQVGAMAEKFYRDIVGE